MKRGSWADDPARIRAAAVDNIIHVSTLVREGMPERTAYRRCQDGGPWTLEAPATIRLGTGTPSRRELVRAGLVYAGDAAVLTGLDAARAHRLRRGDLPDDVHLLIPEASRVHGVPGIRIERTERMPVPPLIRDGFPVAPIERCLLDATRRMTVHSDIAAILTEPVQRRMLLPETLAAELESGSRRGSAAPRAVLRAVAAGARSAAEVDFHTWWYARPELREHEIVFNVRLSRDDRFLGIPDAFLPDRGLVLPIDSVEQHFMTPEQVADTERQHRAYRSAGLHVYGIRPSRTRTASSGLLRDVLDAITVADSLPHVDVRWLPDLPRAA